MKIPKVREGEVVVLCAERATGIVLNNDGSSYLGLGESYYRIFGNLTMARQYAHSINSTSSVGKEREVLMYDSKGEFIEIVIPS